MFNADNVQKLFHLLKSFKNVDVIHYYFIMINYENAKKKVS